MRPLLCASFSLPTPHKEILPIKHVMEISPLRVRTATVPNARPWPVPSGLRTGNRNFSTVPYVLFPVMWSSTLSAAT